MCTEVHGCHIFLAEMLKLSLGMDAFDSKPQHTHTPDLLVELDSSECCWSSCMFDGDGKVSLSDDITGVIY